MMKYFIWLCCIGGYLLVFVVGMVFGIVNLFYVVVVVDDLFLVFVIIVQVLVFLILESFVVVVVFCFGLVVVCIDMEIVVICCIDFILDDLFFQEFFGRFFFVFFWERCIVGQGSGFIIDNSGIIFINVYVVDGVSKVVVIFWDGCIFDGQVWGIDEVIDLVVVKIEFQGFVLLVVFFGIFSNLQVGDWAIVVGNLVGLDNIVILGIISILGRFVVQVGIFDKWVEFI